MAHLRCVQTWRYNGSMKTVRLKMFIRMLTTVPRKANIQVGDMVKILDNAYKTDHLTNVTPNILNKVGRNLQNQKHHPLYLIKSRIRNFFYSFLNNRGKPIFSFHDNISPVVTLHQNFESLLFPHDHPARNISDSYYINSEHMLRTHTSAHQSELIKSGLDSFLVCGDAYRRDEVDSSHYPVFHQIEGVRLFTETELFSSVNNPDYLTLFENGSRTKDNQECHNLAASKFIEYDLKNALQDLAMYLFDKDIEMQWVDTYFPFTHPSWELEIKYQGKWLEVLGCGIIEQEVLNKSGARHKAGWAFGLGLERLAMRLYDIPDIRLFWSDDSGFLSQFAVDDPNTSITYKAISKYPQCVNDISFWLPSNYSKNDFYDLVRSIGGDLVEQVILVDDFLHPKKQRWSHCYRIIYRHMSRTLTNEEVNVIHRDIEKEAASQLNVEIR